MKVKIIWDNGVVQEKELIVHDCMRKNNKVQYFLVGSPLYEAIANNTFFIDLGFGKHSFRLASYVGID